MARLNDRYREPYLRMQPYLVAYLYRLPLWNNAVGAVYVATHQIFEAIVTVEPTAPLPELGDPRPYILCSPRDGDASCSGEIGVRNEIIAWQRRRYIFVRSAPPQLP